MGNYCLGGNDFVLVIKFNLVVVFDVNCFGVLWVYLNGWVILEEG